MIALPPANEVCEGYVFTGVCLSTVGGMHGRGAMQGCGGVCMVAGGHAWLQGVCVVAGGVCMGGMSGCWGHVWLQGAYMVVGGHA